MRFVYILRWNSGIDEREKLCSIFLHRQNISVCVKNTFDPKNEIKCIVLYFLFPFQRFFVEFTGFVACTGDKDQLGADYGTPGHQLPCPKSPSMH